MIYVYAREIDVLTIQQFKTVCKDDSGYITQPKRKNKKVIILLCNNRLLFVVTLKKVL